MGFIYSQRLFEWNIRMEYINFPGIRPKNFTNWHKVRLTWKCSKSILEFVHINMEFNFEYFFHSTLKMFISSVFDWFDHVNRLKLIWSIIMLEALKFMATVYLFYRFQENAYFTTITKKLCVHLEPFTVYFTTSFIT